jgi:neopullulanase
VGNPEEEQAADAHASDTHAGEAPAGQAPDPYVWQPPARGAWTPDWVRDAVFYQIFPDRFARSGEVPEPGPFEPWDAPPTPNGIKGGDLAGITAGLDRLIEFGITALYLNPVFTSASNHRYHTDDYFAADPLLGGNEALQRLLDAAHAKGLRVILDGVFNHTGRGHQPFVQVLENGASSPYRGWYHFDQGRLEAGRGLTPYLPAGEQPDTYARVGYEAWWGMPALPKLDHRNPAVREFLYRVA